MICPFCDNDKKISDTHGHHTEHLLILSYEDGHIHIHGPIDNKELIKQFIITIAKEADIEIEDEQPQA